MEKIVVAEVSFGKSKLIVGMDPVDWGDLITHRCTITRVKSFNAGHHTFFSEPKILWAGQLIRRSLILDH